MKKNGFTLVEILSVLLILGLIIGIAVPSIFAIANKINSKGLETKLKLISDAAIIYAQNNSNKIKSELGQCFGNGSNCEYTYYVSLNDLVNEGLLTKDGKGDDTCLFINPLNKEECLEKKYYIKITLDDKYKNASAKPIEKYSDKNNTLANYILKNNTQNVTNIPQKGLYRYIGSGDVNNYICFGTNNKDTCKNYQGRHLYRIIGITAETNEIKIIKLSSLGSYRLHDLQNYYPWDNITLNRQTLNNAFLNNANYIPRNSKDRIISYTTWNGDRTWNSTDTSYIGLMYQQDYECALKGCNNSNNFTHSWLHSGNEWVMPQNENTIAIIEGNIKNYNATNYIPVRPVFYLKNAAYYMGKGTLNDPFILNIYYP